MEEAGGVGDPLIGDGNLEVTAMEEAGGVGDPLIGDGNLEVTAMEEASGVRDPLIGDGNLEVSTIPTRIWWPFSAGRVDICIWNGGHGHWEQTKLGTDEQGQYSVELHLSPSIYWFYFCVDGINQHNPYFSWASRESGEKVNYVYVKKHEPDDIKYDSCDGCPIKYKHFKCTGSVYVMGSWDSWKQWHKMDQSKEDHVKLLWLYPGKYQMKFHVDGVLHVDPFADCEAYSNGDQANIVNVTAEPQFHELHGNTAAALLDDFLAMPENEVSVVVKFKVGSLCGSIDPEEKACPCTDVGYMLLNGFLRGFKEEYMRGYSFAGCFKPSDMVVVDGKHCQMRRRATKPLTRANLLLDAYQLKRCLLLKYMKDGLLPPYFTSLFRFLEDPPQDFDSNEASKVRFLGFFDNQVALATPPRRMLSLVNMGQFFKQLPVELRPTFALLFNPILYDYSTWQTTTLDDKFLRKVFMAKRKFDKEGKVTPPVANTSLEAGYSLRVFFVHGPEQSIDNEVQLLTDFAEFDLIIAHHFKGLLADFLYCVYENQHAHPLIKAMWDFYCGGAPPDHLQLELCSPPAAPPEPDSS